MGAKLLRAQIKKVWVLRRLGSEKSALVHPGLLAVLGRSASSISRLMQSFEVLSLLRGREISFTHPDGK